MRWIAPTVERKSFLIICAPAVGFTKVAKSVAVQPKPGMNPHNTVPLTRSLLMPCVIALDAMGGDHAPSSVFEGAQRALDHNPDVRFEIFGSSQALQEGKASYPHLQACSRFHVTEGVVLPTDKPSVALRQRRHSSMALAIQAVAQGQAQAVVSSGNTGAYMALARFILKSLPGLDRPAIVKALPTLKGHSVVLDLGANTECTPLQLFEFALMGGVYAQVMLHKERPTIGLLNIGSEDIKGDATIQEAAKLCQDHLPSSLVFQGYVEGDDIALGTVDVVVTDGFTGNVALKTAEGTARLVTTLLRRSFQASFLGKVSALLAKRSLRSFKEAIEPRRYNGAIFLGLQGVAVKSHGGTDGFGFSCAIEAARELAAGHVVTKVQDVLSQLPTHIVPTPDRERK